MNSIPNPKKHSEEKRQVYIPPPIPPTRNRTAGKIGLIAVGTIGFMYSIYSIFVIKFSNRKRLM